MSRPGVIGRFESGEALLAAARRARDRGGAVIDAFSPHPVEGLGEVLRLPAAGVARATLAGGILGGGGGYFLQWYASVAGYPLNVGGRPLHSWPAFIPITFELTVLGAGLAGLLAMLALNRLPRLHHPVFDVPGFERATRDGYFLALAADGPGGARAARRLLLEAGAAEVHDVAA